MKKRNQDITHFILSVCAIILVNIIASNFFFRIDLTEEKRFSISNATKNMLSELDDEVYVEVYLEGEFPAGFKRLQSSIKETLEEFKIYGNNNIRYDFIDPNDFSDNKTKNKFHQQLAEKGIQPTNLVAQEDGGKVEKIIFPGAIIRYKEKETSVQLLSGNRGASADEQLNHSVEAVEYNFADAIRKLNLTKKKKIAFLQDHGELSGINIASITNELAAYYDVKMVNLREKVSLNEFDLVVCAKPTKTFSDTSVFKLDQYVVKGGNALFLVDNMDVVLDSIGEQGSYILPYELNLKDWFFKLGVRLNNDLIKDFYCGFLPMMTGYTGNQPQMQLMPWRFYPMINTFGTHPISKNLGGIMTRFVGSIDSIKAVGIAKTPLLFTSKYTRIVSSPVRVNFNEARIEVDPNTYINGSQAVGYLLEGEFTSMYKNRLTKSAEEKFEFKEKEKPAKVVIFSDGDLISNHVNPKTGTPYPLGYDMFLQRFFANKELILNTVDYMLDDSQLIQARNKEVVLRPIDKIKVKNDALFYQVLNIALPITLVIIFGMIWFYIRKRKFEKFT